MNMLERAKENCASVSEDRRKGKRERKSERKKEIVCVYVRDEGWCVLCVCVSKKEREN